VDEAGLVKRLSDRALRRVAWGVWWFLVAMFTFGSFIDRPDSPDSWGGGGGWLGDLVFGVVVLSFPLIGLLVLRRQPRNTIGWLLQGVGLVWALAGLADNYAAYGLLVDPGSLPAAAEVAAVNEGIWVPGIGLMGTYLILLFPDGHLPSPRWRPVAWLSGLTMVALTTAVIVSPGRLEEGPVPTMENPLALESAGSLIGVLLVASLVALPLCIIACAGALVGRFRRAQGVERLQLKWLATAGALVASIYLLAIAAGMFGGVTTGGGPPTWVKVVEGLAVLSFLLLPLAIGAAVLRYRLYDIDVVINRTLVYGLLTVTLSAVYLGSVLVLQLALRPLTDRSDLAVAASTLGVAALFRPARARIQSAVDRRFYRRRYDATRILEAFADRLRHELDLEAVAVDLRDAVLETVQPAHVSLWLRP
jgi:hypothetical protein